MSRLRTFALVASLLALGAGRSLADDVHGKVKSVDPDKNTLTLTVGDADKTLPVATDARVTGLFGKKLKKAVTEDVPGGLRGVKEGALVTLTTEKGEVKKVSVDDLQPKVKKKGKGKGKAKKAKKAA